MITSTKVKIEKTANRKVIDLTPFLQFLSMIKIYHWRATSKSHHETFGDIYEQISDKIDEFVECFMGSTLSVLWNCSDIPMDVPENINDILDFAKLTDSFIEDATNFAGTDTALQSLIDDISNICYRGIYLLKMS